MLKRLSSVIIAVLILSSGCAYFNTFYNAKKAFHKGQEASRKQKNATRGVAGKTDFDLAIAKSQKILDNYGESRWVDDALLLMAKSFYYQKQYYPALRQLTRLKREFPDSDLLPETELYRAKSYLAISSFDSVRVTLSRLLAGKNSAEIEADAHMVSGELAEERGQFTLAAESYRAALTRGLRPDPYRGHIALATVLDTLGQYAQAAESYMAVRESDASPEWKLWARLRYARALNRMGQYDQCIQYLESMLSSDRFKKAFPRIKLEIANALAHSGDDNAAIMAYQDLILDHPKSIEEAEANYYMGKIYLYDKFDYERALKSFHEAAETGKQIAVVDTANLKKRDIQRMVALRRVIAMADRGETGDLSVEKMTVTADTLGNYADSMRIQLRVDSLITEGYGEAEARQFLEEETLEKERELQELQEESGSGDPLDGRMQTTESRKNQKKKKTVIENPELKSFKTEEADKNLFLLAELYFFNFNQPDSAAHQYLRIIEEHAESPYRVRAMHNYVNLLESTGEVQEAGHWRKTLAEAYPNSPYRYSGQTINSVDASPWQLLEKAENTLFDAQNVSEAYKQYKEITDKHGKSEAAVNALFAMAWIAETKWDSLSLAQAHYDSLRYWYPDTPQATVAIAKVEAAERGLPKPAPVVPDAVDVDSVQTVVQPADSMLVAADSVQTIAEKKDSDKPVQGEMRENEAERAHRMRLAEQRNKRMGRREREVEGENERPAGKDASRILPKGGMSSAMKLLDTVFPNDKRPKALNELVFELTLKEDGKVSTAVLKTKTGDQAVDAALLKMIKTVQFNLQGTAPGTEQRFALPLAVIF